MSKINDLQAVRDKLAEDWAPWARKVEIPAGYSSETIEYVLMRFGCQPPRATGSAPIEHNPEAEAIERVVVSMPGELRRFILTEFITRTPQGERLTKQDKAKLTHTSPANYYKNLDLSLAWLHGKV